MEKSEAMAVRALGQAEEGQGELVIHGTFKCANCGGEFNKSRSDEEAMAEAKQIFSPAELARATASSIQERRRRADSLRD
jgi:hypothetical protein